ncbi:hypothetical protein Tco_1210458 [Tanacetum coccineum]
MNLKRRSKNRQERWSGNRKFLQQSSIPRSLAIWGKDDGITTLVKSILDGSGSVSFGQGGGGTSCGRDGLWAQHILDALCGEGSATATDLLKAITSVVNLWSAGRCPPILAEFVAMKGVVKEMSKYLGDIQFGVGVSGDAEAILHSVNTLLSKYHNEGLLVNAHYSEEVARVLDIIKVSGPGLGLELNNLETEIFWPSCNGVNRHEGLFLVDIRTPSLGLKLLGGVVSRNTYFISGMAMRRAVNIVNLMSLLPQLHNPQSELLLL